MCESGPVEAPNSSCLAADSLMAQRWSRVLFTLKIGWFTTRSGEDRALKVVRLRLGVHREGYEFLVIGRTVGRATPQMIWKLLLLAVH